MISSVVGVFHAVFPLVIPPPQREPHHESHHAARRVITHPTQQHRKLLRQPYHGHNEPHKTIQHIPVQPTYSSIRHLYSHFSPERDKTAEALAKELEEAR